MKDTPKFCKDCKHYEWGRYVDKCKAMGPEQVDLIEGCEDFPAPQYMRRDESRCGRSGKLFEQKVAWYKFWE